MFMEYKNSSTQYNKDISKYEKAYKSILENLTLENENDFFSHIFFVTCLVMLVLVAIMNSPSWEHWIIAYETAGVLIYVFLLLIFEYYVRKNYKIKKSIIKTLSLSLVGAFIGINVWLVYYCLYFISRGIFINDIFDPSSTINLLISGSLVKGASLGAISLIVIQLIFYGAKKFIKLAKNRTTSTGGRQR